MMPVVERNLQVPAAVGLAFHRMRGRVPIVKTADEINRLRLRRQAQEIGRERGAFGGVTVAAARTV